MVENDRLTGEDLIRKRRAFQRFVQENPTMRMPIQSGDTAGIDAETSWDYNLDDPDPYKHIVPDKTEVRRLAIEINEAYQQGGSNAVAAKIEAAKLREDYKRKREAEYANRAIGATPPTPDPEAQERAAEAFETQFRSMAQQQPIPDNIVVNGTIITEEEEVQVPADFQGVEYSVVTGPDNKKEERTAASLWKKVQFQCCTRDDTDYTYPDDLTDDIKAKVHKITVLDLTAIGGARIYVAVQDKDDNTLYYENIPADLYFMAFKENIGNKVNEENPNLL